MSHNFLIRKLKLKTNLKFKTFVYTSNSSLYSHSFMHTKQNIIPPLMYVMYANASNNTFIHTHVSLYMVHRQEPLGNKLALTFPNITFTSKPNIFLRICTHTQTIINDLWPPMATHAIQIVPVYSKIV